MKAGRQRGRSAGVAAMAIAGGLILASCGHRGDKVAAPGEVPVVSPAPVAGAPAATPALSPQRRYEFALTLLQKGQVAQAQAELQELERQHSTDRRVTSLLRQIDTDPKILYGGDNFAYTVRAGDTLFSLSKKFLRNPLNFYGLARYNGLTLPVDLAPGQVIQIPGRAPAFQPPVAPRRPAPTAPPSAGEDVRPAPRPDGGAQREQAQLLRRQGLEQMSAGSIDRAVTLLSQAATLDPQNGAITADLARARRIQTTVRNR